MIQPHIELFNMDKLNSIIEKIFKISPSDITDQMSPQTIPSWDSLNYLTFISEVEKEFKISFSMDEVLNSKNLGDIKQAMRAKGVSV